MNANKLQLQLQIRRGWKV